MGGSIPRLVPDPPPILLLYIVSHQGAPGLSHTVCLCLFVDVVLCDSDCLHHLNFDLNAVFLCKFLCKGTPATAHY